MRQLNVFQQNAKEKAQAFAPLAERMRPDDLERFVGQAHLLGPGKILDRMLRNRQYQSMILWGPPGCGKTTLAGIIASRSGAHLIALSAVMAGTKEIRAAVEEARFVWAKEKRRTWLFMDEVHRLNKAQQDVLLPHVEAGTILLLGATTENPSFEVIRPLLSRSQVLVLEPLGELELRLILEAALQDRERGLAAYPARVTAEAEAFLFAACGGDARVLLNGLEVAVLTTPPEAETGVRVIDLEAMREAMHRRAVHYDKAGEEHFNLISAFHKSLRGSDPDAALYWLARMLDAGEEPRYIARRLVRAASEDVGLADPFALIEANAALQAYDFLGSPEGELALAQATVYISLAPKSNALDAGFGKASEAARKSGMAPVPLHLRNAPTALMKRIGYGSDYQYAHDDPRGWVPDTYLPEDLVGSVYYEPTSRGWEGKWRQTLLERREEVKRTDRARGKSRKS
ncbi:MAG: replication-associated recombination protein A [Syntrophobacteraceae bacterium]